MKSHRFYLLSLSTLLFLLSSLSAQNPQTYRHPGLNLQVQVFDDWVQVAHPEDALLYEITDPESVLRVMLWQTATEVDGQHYLRNIAEKKELVYNDEPSLTKINDRDAWLLDATCCMNKTPIRVVLVALPDAQEDKSLYIAQFLCPEDRLEEKEASMEEIIYSLRITN